MKSLKRKLTDRPLNMHDNGIVDIDITYNVSELVNTKTRDKITYTLVILQEIWWKLKNEINET
jgi:hypothetical protein